MTAVWTELVEDARFAPSPHNTQPWRVRARSDHEAELEVPLERLLPVEDPEGRFLTAGVGIFLEALDVAAAARGLALRYEPLYPQLGAHAAEPSLAARMRLEPRGEEPAPAVELLHRRRTARGRYDGRPAPEAALAELAGIARAFGHEARFTSDPELVDWIVGLNADTLFEDLREDDRRAEIGQWTHFSDRARPSLPATGSRRPAWASPGRSSGCSSAITACGSRRRCARSCAASTSAGRAAPQPSAGSPGRGRPPLSSSTPGAC